MELQQFYNNAAAALVGGITDSQTTITIGGGEIANFPTSLTGGRYFLLTISDNTLQMNVRETVWEIVRVTAVLVDGSNLDLTVVRGQEGTAAAAWLNGNLCSVRNTAASLARSLEEPHFDRILTAGGEVLVDGSGNVLSS